MNAQISGMPCTVYVLKKCSQSMYCILSISSFHSVCVHSVCTAARSAPQIIDKVKKKELPVFTC